MPNVIYQTDQGPKTISFSATPSAQDIDEVAQKQGWKAAAQASAGPTPTPAPPTPDQQSAQQYSPSFPANTQNPSITEPAKAVGNIPSSALNFGKSALNFLNPLRSVPQAFSSLFGLAKSVPGTISDSTRTDYGGQQSQVHDQQVSAANKVINTQASQAAGQGTTATSLLNPITAEDPSLGKTLSDTITGSAKGVYEGVVPQAAQQLVAGDTQGAQRTITNDPVGQILPFLALGEKVKPGVVSDTVGAAKSAVRPVSNFAIGPTATDAVANVASKVGNLASKLPQALLGEENAATIKAAQNPAAQAFEGGNTIAKVANKTTNAVNTFIQNSKDQLKAVKDSIPDVPIPTDTFTNAVNKGITDSVQSSADYRGVKGPLTSPEDVVNKGILNPQETTIMNNAVDFIKQWQDKSARGTLNLKEELDRFVRPGENYQGSNAIIRSVQRSLKGVVGDVAPQIKPALEQASKNIDLADELQTQLLGNNPASTEAKLNQLSRGISDPAKNGYKLGLLQQLKGLTGYDAVPELKGYQDYQTAKSLKRPSVLEPAQMAKYAGTKALIKYGKSKQP